MTCLRRRGLKPLKRDHALLDPGQLSGIAEEAAQDLMAEGESDNTRLAYRAAMRYWAAWFGARYGRQMALPVAALWSFSSSWTTPSARPRRASKGV